MIQRRRVLINAVASVLQVGVTGLSFFLLYRYLYRTIGVELVGVWGMVLAATSVNQLANLGLAGSTVMFVARYRARQEPDRVNRVVQTSVVSVALFMAVALLAVYPLLQVLIRWAVTDASQVPIALSVLPYAVTSLWLTATGHVILSAVDGFERVDVRNWLLMASMLIYLALAWILVPGAGLIGLAQAQVIQSLILLIGAWFALRHLFRKLPLVPIHWSFATFKEMLSYNVQFQITSVAQMLFDPTARILIVRLGGLEAAGFFEMAHKMVIQLRAFIVTAHQSMVPTIANLQETAPELLKDVYAKSFRLILFLVLPSLPLLVALVPVISLLYLGALEPIFILYADLLLLGWFLNLFSAPAYFANLGIGSLRGNVIGHITAGILNLGLGAGLGVLFGGIGVVIGFMVALVIGSLMTTILHQREHRIGMGQLFERDSLLLGLTSLAGLIGGLVLYRMVGDLWNPWATGLLIATVYVAVVSRPLWAHSTRERLLKWIHRDFLERAR